MDVNSVEEIKLLWEKRNKLDGIHKALRKVKEELAELTVAISHLEDGKSCRFKVMDEIVDVQLQLERLMVIFNETKYQEFYVKQRKKKYEWIDSITGDINV